jgi:hypothetical protein
MPTGDDSETAPPFRQAEVGEKRDVVTCRRKPKAYAAPPRLVQLVSEKIEGQANCLQRVLAPNQRGLKNAGCNYPARPLSRPGTPGRVKTNTEELSAVTVLGHAKRGFHEGLHRGLSSFGTVPSNGVRLSCAERERPQMEFYLR